MSSETFRDRYRRGDEPMLNHLVDSMAGVLLREELSSPDLARCAVLATRIYAERYCTTIVVRIDGELHFEPIPGLYDERHRGPDGGDSTD